MSRRNDDDDGDNDDDGDDDGDGDCDHHDGDDDGDDDDDDAHPIMTSCMFWIGWRHQADLVSVGVPWSLFYPVSEATAQRHDVLVLGPEMKWQELDYHPFSLLELSCFTLWQTDTFIYPQNDPNVATYPLVFLTYI